MKDKIVFLYNVRKIYPSGEDRNTHVDADLDDQETIDYMIKHLQGIFGKKNVIAVEADENVSSKLHKIKDKVYIAFNYSEGLRGNDREAQIPAILENLGIPYTGSSPKTQAVVLDKALT